MSLMYGRGVAAGKHGVEAGAGGAGMRLLAQPSGGDEAIHGGPSPSINGVAQNQKATLGFARPPLV